MLTLDAEIQLCFKVPRRAVAGSERGLSLDLAAASIAVVQMRVLCRTLVLESCTGT